MLFKKWSYGSCVRVLLVILTLFFCAFNESVRAQNVNLNEDEHYKQIKNDHYQQLKQKFRSNASAKTFSVKKAKPQENTIRVIVETTKSVKSDLQNVEIAARAKGASVKRKIERLDVLALNVNEAQLDALFADSRVQVLSEDKLLEPSLGVSVPYIGAKALQDAGFKGQGQAVAILDTGVDSSHPFLSGRVVEEACFSSGDGQSVLSLCPNGQNRQVGAGAAHDCTNRLSIGDCMHGTHVAGIAAGASGTMNGVAPQASIVAVQVFIYGNGSYRLGAYGSDILAGFDWLISEAHTANIAAVNLSLGGGSYTGYCDDALPALTTAIQTLRARGTATVIASGNDGSTNGVSWPGCISAAVTVGASYHDQDQIAWFSNTASMVDVVAPGLDINSSVPGGGYAVMSGTSMATPHVTGAFAELKSVIPGASVDQVEQAMKQGGKIIHTTTGIDLPRVDVLAASSILKNGNGSGQACSRLPGEITPALGALVNGTSKSWNTFAPQGGLFRVWVSNSAAFSSNLIQVTFNGTNMNMSVAAGSSALVDFANVNAGMNTLKVTALSDGVNLGRVWVEQLANNSTVATGTCAVAVPSLIDDKPFTIPVNTEKVWSISAETQRNLRILVTSGSSLSSRSIVVTLDSVNVNISIDAGQTVPIDFPNILAGIHQLKIKALSDSVVVGKLKVDRF